MIVSLKSTEMLLVKDGILVIDGTYKSSIILSGGSNADDLGKN